MTCESFSVNETRGTLVVVQPRAKKTPAKEIPLRSPELGCVIRLEPRAHFVREHGAVEPVFDAGVRAELERAAEYLLRADREIALVARAAPVELEPRSGRRNARKRAAALDLGPTRSALERVARTTEPFGWIGRLHAERARELELEARIVERFETAELSALVAERFPSPRGAVARACDEFTADALAKALPEAERVHRSDDLSDPASLIRVLSRRAREIGLPLSVEVRPEQLATAATGEGIVAVRPSVMLPARAGERIAVHELFGHALPRARALHAPLRLFRAGTARSADDEEGRALLVERRAGLFDAERRRELSLRHRAALAVRSGAEPHETLRLLESFGTPRETARELARRAHRGGGLAREIVYLPAYFTVSSALAENPALERWLERGRLDLGAARLFADGADHALSSSITTGA